MALNEYITLGRSGLRVSPFCLGGMTFGNDLGWGSDIDESETVLSRYLEAGGNFIDTANSYTRGHSEKIIGDYFTQKKGKRDRVVLATKFFFNLFAGDPTVEGLDGKRSSLNAKNPCDVFKLTTLICTTCIIGTGLRQSRRRCVHSTIW